MPDKGNNRILILMPARNEQGRIGVVIGAARRTVPGADLVVVNDDSSDATAAEALAAGAIVLPHPVNLGYGAGLETGYTYAVRNGYDLVLQMDADGQHVADELPFLLAPLLSGRADLVLGSRFLGPGTCGKIPTVRRMGQRFFAGILHLLTGQRFTDPTSGFQGLNGRTLALFSSGVFPCDYPDADVLLMAHRAGLNITEVPVVMRPRTGGTSMHSGLKPLYYGIKMLLSLFIVLLNSGLWHAWCLQHPGPAACAGSPPRAAAG